MAFNYRTWILELNSFLKYAFSLGRKDTKFERINKFCA